MKILNWNVNGIRACAPKGLLQLIKKEQPDTICLQEIKAFETQCPDIKNALGFENQFWNSAERPGYSGVLTAYNDPKWKSDLGMRVNIFDAEGRVIVTDLGDFQLVNLYFPNGAQRHEFKMSFLDKVMGFFRKLDQKKPVIMTGDFNIAHKAIDIHDPKGLDGTSGFMPVEREWMDELVKLGFVDTFRLLYPDQAEKYSWWSYRAGARQRNKGWRIDYFFVSDRLKKRVKDMRHLHNEPGSDHCPLILEID